MKSKDGEVRTARSGRRLKQELVSRKVRTVRKLRTAVKDSKARTAG